MLLTIFVHILAASTKPSAIIAVLAVAATATYVVWIRDPAVEGLTRLVLAVASCLLLWSAVAVWINDQYPSHLLRLGQTTMGIAMLWAVGVSVNTLPRIRIATAAIVAATFVSAALGICIIVSEEPFLSFRLWIAELSELGIDQWSEQGVRLPSRGRIAGLAARSITFAYHLAVAIPLAVGLLLVLPLRLFSVRLYGEGSSELDSHKTSRHEWIWRVALVVVLTGLTTALILNASRSALLGVFLGGMVALAPMFVKLSGIRLLPNLISLAVIGIATFAVINLLTVKDEGAFNRRIVSVQDHVGQGKDFQ